MKKFEIDPALGIAQEGFWGICWMSVLLPVLGRINSPFGLGPMENVSGWLYQLSHSRSLLLLQLMYFTVTLFNNSSGFATTKNASASVRTTFSTMRPLIIWVVSLILEWEGF